MLNQCAPFPLNDSESILMPLYWPLLYRKDRVRNYERPQTTAFAAAIDRLGPGTMLVDCGADVGLFTRLTLAKTRNVARVIAIEPNPRSHFVLSQNLAGCPMETKAMWAAVSDYDGTADLTQATYNEGDHARYIDHKSGGDTPVLRIDSLNLPTAPLALKIDVEGKKLNVINGARETLMRAPAFAVQIEANVDVVARTSLDPVDIVAAVQKIRPTTIAVIHDYEGVIGSSIATDRKFFDQYPGHQSCDILMVAADRQLLPRHHVSGRPETVVGDLRRRGPMIADARLIRAIGDDAEHQRCGRRLERQAIVPDQPEDGAALQRTDRRPGFARKADDGASLGRAAAPQ